MAFAFFLEERLFLHVVAPFAPRKDSIIWALNSLRQYVLSWEEERMRGGKEENRGLKAIVSASCVNSMESTESDAERRTTMNDGHISRKLDCCQSCWLAAAVGW